MEFGKDIFSEVDDLGEEIGYGYGNDGYRSREEEEGDEE